MVVGKRGAVIEDMRWQAFKTEGAAGFAHAYFAFQYGEFLKFRGPILGSLYELFWVRINWHKFVETPLCGPDHEVVSRQAVLLPSVASGKTVGIPGSSSNEG